MKLIVNNSESQILGLTPEQFKSLKKVLSYKIDPQAAFFSRSWNPVRYLIDKRGVFPTGLLPRVIRWITDGGLGYEMVDRRVRPTEHIDLRFDFNFEPYPEQTEAMNAALRHERGIIRAPTGTGKTAIAALICWGFQLKTLIVVPSLELKRQVTESLHKFFGEPVVGPLTKDERYWIAVENVDALDPKFVLKRTGLLIVDEFHHSGAATYRKLNKTAWSQIYARIGMSATPFRSKDNEAILLESVLSDTIYTLEYKTAVEKGYIVPVEAFYVEVPTIKVKGNSRNWASVYSELVVNNDTRNRLIYQLLNKLGDKSTLCLVKEIKHGEHLQHLSGRPFVNGQDEETRRYIDDLNECRITQLLGTDGVIGEGIDTKPVEYVIIAGLGKAKGRFMQQVGRGIRTYPGKISAKVIIFKDLSHKWTAAHFKAQCKILKEEYGVIPKKLVLR